MLVEGWKQLKTAQFGKKNIYNNMKFKKLKLKTIFGDNKKIALTKNPTIKIKGLAFSMEPLEMVIEPRGGESKDEFISRCISAESDKYPQEQAIAICYSKWENKKSFSFKIDDKKQILVAPVMIPNLVMTKMVDGVPTDVYFDEQGVKDFMIDFEREYIEREGNVFNLEHKNKMVPVTRLESWYVEGEGDKARSVYGFDVPDGTPMMSLYIEDKEFFDDYVQTGVGFSIEGLFDFEEEDKDEKYNKWESSIIPDEYKDIWKKLLG